jgi:hypothetical protein
VRRAGCKPALQQDAILRYERTAGRLTFTDTNAAPFTHRFYRARLP